MSCVPGPSITLGSLPSGISVDPPALPAITTPGLCCQFVDPFTVVPPIALTPLVANAAVLVALNATLQGIETWVNSLVPDCPRGA